MNCPNCGLAHADGARFCSNCGTAFGPPPNQGSYQQQSQYSNQGGYAGQPAGNGPYRVAGSGSNLTARNIGLGCLIALLLFFFMTLSCARSCFGLRRHYYVHRY